jgi:TPP-dependent pyruvate/acetoin dehydrogenase alpha subunit
MKSWRKSRDPIPTFTTYLQARHVLTDEKMKEIEGRIAQTLDEAVEYAMNAPDPGPEDAVTDLYAQVVTLWQMSLCVLHR